MSESEQATTTNGDAAAESSLRRYLAEIRRYPLLTRAEEVGLAQRAAAGDPGARRRLVESNLRLVIAIAKPYRSGGHDLLDLVQEGNLGLMKAVDRYDSGRGTKFSTYASWWIRAAIVDSLNAGSRPIRVPDSIRRRARDVRRTERALMARYGRRPTTPEIASELDLTAAEVAEARAAGLPVGSLDEPVGAEGGELRQADVLADPNADDPLELLVEEATEGELEARLRTLPDRTRRVLELRFGLGDTGARTADEVAAELGISRERVRQIELHALRGLATVAVGGAVRAA